MNSELNSSVPTRRTFILAVDMAKIGRIILKENPDFVLDDWEINLDESSEGVKNLRLAAAQLKDSHIPVAFPTETVYGLGADATRSEAVKGIYKAKQRPSDNPLIVHFASLRQLEQLLHPAPNGFANGYAQSSIPAIYKPLIQKFWPGPLTIILPNPLNSVLTPEVTAGLSTFGARMPRNLLALVLIKLANIPIAAPSANASTKPSPTTAEHVKDDLDGRIDFILDGGPCDVGVESTVVDGLSDPPAILRPGGISIEQLRTCPGWENVVVGYKDASEKNGAPRAPGMKYRHYSPAAKVILHESGSEMPTASQLDHAANSGAIGIIRTRKWPLGASLRIHEQALLKNSKSDSTKAGGNSIFESVFLRQKKGSITPLMELQNSTIISSKPDPAVTLPSFMPTERPAAHCIEVGDQNEGRYFVIWDIRLGPSTEDIARDLFWALRDLDRKKCDAIFVEGIGDEEGDVAAAVMNRLRKAAGAEVKM